MIWILMDEGAHTKERSNNTTRSSQRSIHDERVEREKRGKTRRIRSKEEMW